MSTINNVFLLNNNGPWTTKSNAELNVLFGLDLDFIQKIFLKYNKKELSKLKTDIRGLRSYIVKNIPLNSIGANEWHKVRNEIAIVVEGEIEWSLMDTNGHKKTFSLNENQGIYIPNNILHTYRALQNNSLILIIANTQKKKKNANTHDTYTIDTFNNVIQK